VLLIGNAASAISGPIGYLISMAGSESTWGYVMAGHSVAGSIIAVGAAYVFGSAVAVAAVASLTIVSWNIWLVVLGGKTLGVWSTPASVRRRLQRSGTGSSHID